MDTFASQEPDSLAGLPGLALAGPFEATEAEMIFPRNARLQQIGPLMERLHRVERQSQQILVLIFAITISAFIFLLLSDLSPKPGMFMVTQGIPATSFLDLKAAAGSSIPVTELLAGEYAGVKTSHEYHRPDCRAVLTAPLDDLIPLKSAAGAQRLGYKPCPLCQRPKAH